jgi:ankyrin repeat protein
MESELVRACIEGETDYVKNLIEHGLDINTTNSYGESILSIACLHNNVDIIKFLLFYEDQTIDVNKKDLHQKTCLMQLCSRGNLELVIQIIKKNADIYAMYYNETCICCAVKGNHLDIVKYLFDIFVAKLFHRFDEYYKCWTFNAIKNSSFEMVQFFIERIKDINIFMNNVISYEKSLMYMSCCYGRLDVIKYLLNKNEPFYSNYDMDDIGSACGNGHLPVLKFFVEELNININDKTENNYSEYADTCLLRAVKSSYYEHDDDFFEKSKRNFDVIQYLVERGAILTATTKKGENCLNLASKIHDAETIKYLIDKIKEKNGEKILKKMINRRGNNRQTCLLGICGRGLNIELIKILVEAGADVNATDYNTCLIYACDSNDLELVKYLLDNGAKINATNVNGTTALSRTIRLNGKGNTYNDIIEHLKQKGGRIVAT